MPFVARVPVRFGDVDYARIVYYPRLLHLLHVAFEDYFAHHVGVPYDRLITERNLGFPAVHLDADFRSPLRLGDLLEVEMEVARIGRCSVEFAHRVRVGPDSVPRATARITRVAVDMQSLKSVPIPDWLRRSFGSPAPR